MTFGANDLARVHTVKGAGVLHELQCDLADLKTRLQLERLGAVVTDIHRRVR